jgi:hypothetical protein
MSIFIVSFPNDRTLEIGQMIMIHAAALVCIAGRSTVIRDESRPKEKLHRPASELFRASSSSACSRSSVPHEYFSPSL